MDSLKIPKTHMRVIEGSFSYIDPSAYSVEKPYYFSGPLDSSEEHLRTNLAYKDVKDVPIRNLRGFEEHRSLETNGWEYLQTPTTLSDQHLNVADLEPYLAAATSLLRIHLNAQLVLIYDYRVSNSLSGEPC